MAGATLKFYKVLELPTEEDLEPDAVYFVKGELDVTVTVYITDSDGVAYPIT